jgi:hypothetical protein
MPNVDEVRTALFRKEPTTDNLALPTQEENKQWYKVGRIIHLAPAEYAHFSQNLLDDYEWLENIAHVAIVTDGTNSIVVDTQGYTYARYVGLVLGTK